MIPKVIHYCWFGNGEMNVLHRRCVESWRKLCPDYEIRLWNESNSRIDNEYCRAAIKRKKWAFVADWVRFDVLHKHGGIYLDTDLELIRPLDGLLDQRACLAARESKRSIATAFIACLPGDPVMAAARQLVLEDLVRRRLFATSPKIIKKAIEMVGPERCVVLPPKSFYPFNPHERDNPQNARQFMYSDVTEETIGVHHYRVNEASWADSRMRRGVLRVLKKMHIEPAWGTTHEPF